MKELVKINKKKQKQKNKKKNKKKNPKNSRLLFSCKQKKAKKCEFLDVFLPLSIPCIWVIISHLCIYVMTMSCRCLSLNKIMLCYFMLCYVMKWTSTKSYGRIVHSA